MKGNLISDEVRNPNGFIIDFSKLKSAVEERILRQYDHSLTIAENKEKEHLLQDVTTKLNVLPFAPSCENLLVHFAELLKDALPGSISLHRLLLHETANNYAEWYAEDNE